MNALNLKDFVREALARGVGREEISKGLRQAGWPEKEIQEGLDSFVDAGLPLPVPRCQASGSPREAFLHLLMFFALGVWVTAQGPGSQGPGSQGPGSQGRTGSCHTQPGQGQKPE